MRLGSIVPLSTVDWYGHPSFLVFFAGCNFRCPYCQNPELIPKSSGKVVELEWLCRQMEISLKPVETFDAVVFTGGEPLVQRESVSEAAELVKDLGIKLMLDTNGSCPGAVERLLDGGLIDRIALDVKAPFNAEDYGKVIGVPMLGHEMSRKVRRTLELCSDGGIEVEARTTVAPTLSDSPEFIRRLASCIKGLCDVYYLQQFDNTGEVFSPRFNRLLPPERGKLVLLAEAALAEGVKNVFIKTRELGRERIG
jgi:pyruvate formate lyase activating enzyme